MLEYIESWERFDWTADQQKTIYRDWAEFYTRKQRHSIADKYFALSLNLRMDPKVLSQRSKCKREMAQTESALNDSLLASKINKNSTDVQTEICDALYELNDFENCKMALHNNTRNWSGQSKRKIFENRLIVVDENFKDTIGESLTPFILKNEQNFATTVEQIKKEKSIDTRHLWKILLEMGKCDVLSFLEKEEIPVPPIELARRERAAKVINQIYLGKNWVDLLFLRTLKNNQTPVVLDQAAYTSKPLNYIMHNSCRAINKFLKMIQARSPVYNEKMRKCPNKKVCERFSSDNLFRIQYQTRRNMMSILRSIRGLRAMRKVDKLSQFIESLMGDYVVLKTHRIMPWKFEFLSEVYNTLGLAHADSYTMAAMPHNLKTRLTHEQINLMLRLHHVKPKERVMYFVFGDRSSHDALQGTDMNISSLRYKRILMRLEKRLRFSKYSIERAYILHEMARYLLAQGHFEECCVTARKGVIEAKSCNSYLWQFLCTMLIVKDHMILLKVERAKTALNAARILTKYLKSYALYIFIDYLCSLLDVAIQSKKKSQSLESFRRTKSKLDTIIHEPST